MLIDLIALNFPDKHDWHWGCVVTVPAALLYFPGRHVLWAMHESVVTLLRDSVALKNPAVHASHWG